MKLDRVIAVRNNRTVYRDDDRAVKVFVSGYKKSDILSEAMSQTLMEEIGLPVPGVLETSMIDGKWSIVSEYISGKTLERLMAEEPERADEYMDLFVELQNLIHSKTCPSLAKLGDKISCRLAVAKLYGELEADIRARICEMQSQNNVCHGDFVPSNVIVDEDGSPYIIDWAHATQGSRYADIAKTYVSLLMKGEEKTAELYLDKICKNAIIEKQEIKKWVPMIAVFETASK